MMTNKNSNRMARNVLTIILQNIFRIRCDLPEVEASFDGISFTLRKEII
jgi:hypothetical protein